MGYVSAFFIRNCISLRNVYSRHPQGEYSPKILYSRPKPIKFFFVCGPRIIHCYKKLTIKLLFNFNNFNSRLPASSQHHIKYFNPKRHILAWFRAFWAIMLKIGQSVWSLRVPQKKLWKKAFSFWVFLNNLRPTDPNQGVCPWTPLGAGP